LFQEALSSKKNIEWKKLPKDDWDHLDKICTIMDEKADFSHPNEAHVVYGAHLCMILFSEDHYDRIRHFVASNNALYYRAKRYGIFESETLGIFFRVLQIENVVMDAIRFLSNK
jgi:hypothetical protein